MIFGTPFSAGFGEPNLMLKYSYFEPRRLAQGKLFLIFSPRDRFGNCWFGVYIAGIFVGNFYCAEGEVCGIPIPPPAFNNEPSFQIIRIGYMADPGYVIQNVTRTMESDESPLVTWRWTWIPQFVEIEGDNGQISNLVLQNVLVKNSTQVVGYKYFRTLSVDLSFDSDTLEVTVTVSNRGMLLAQGTVPYGTTTVPLSTVVPSVNEGIPPMSGSCTIPAPPTQFASAVAYYRWPKSMNIYRDVVSPPTVAVDSVDFEQIDASTWTEPTALTPGLYYYAIAEVSDTNVVGLLSTIEAEQVNGPPASISNLHFVQEA